MSQVRAHLTPEEEEVLLDELVDVLDRVVASTGCRDMVPLWLVATREPRARHLRVVSGPALELPANILAWSKSMRSKYAALAGWRHAVLAESILKTVDPVASRAVQDMYFTPTDNQPPYSWSKASSRHPNVGTYASTSVFDLKARQGCRDSVAELRSRLDASLKAASLAEEARAEILEAGARDGTLRDVLRYDALDRGKAS